MLREEQPPQEDQLPDGRSGCFSFCHVPQHCRREKLRYATAGEATAPPPPPFNAAHYFPSPYDNGFPPADFFNANPNPNPSLSPLFGGEGFSLSLSPAMFADQQRCHSVGSAGAPPVHRPGPVPSGPFTGYATILNSSSFLRPAQQLLEESCGGGAAAGGSLLAGFDDGETLDIAGDIPDRLDSLDGEQRRIKSRLISMLDEVYRRYKQYDHQIQAVISSFESVSGLSMAAPYSTLALRSLSKHFKSVKKAIADQLRFAGRCTKEAQSRSDPLAYRPPAAAAADSAAQPQPPWRPQRGLPERAVAVLRSWLFEHFLHPYPTDMDKQMLAKQTGLSRNQVSNWFINARVRLWKPMVEEIHSLEQQSDRRQESSGGGGGEKQAAPPAPGSPCKRSRGDGPRLQGHYKDPLSFSAEDLSKVPASFGGGGVSLTLGLHQNGDGICFSDAAVAMPMVQVHRYAMEEGGGVGFGMDFDGQLHHVF